MKEKPLLVEETTKSAINIRNEIGGDALEFSFIEQVSDLTVRFVEIDGLVRVILEIGDKANHKDIRDAIPKILKWRDAVQDLQSDKIAYRLFHGMFQTPTSSKENLLELFSQMQERGKSYAQLAELFNQVLGKLAKAPGSGWYCRKVTIYDAIADGIVERINQKTGGNVTREAFLKTANDEPSRPRTLPSVSSAPRVMQAPTSCRGPSSKKSARKPSRAATSATKRFTSSSASRQTARQTRPSAPEWRP